jgi:hypothetical protein
MELDGSQEHAVLIQSAPSPPSPSPVSLRSILISTSHIRLDSPSGPSLQAFQVRICMHFTSLQSHSAGIAQRYSTGLRAGWSGGGGSSPGHRLGIFLFTTMSRPALWPNQPPIQWVPVALFLKVKRPGREADHSPPSSYEIKNAYSYTSAPTIRLHGMVLS